jgi:hypothetical protein
LKDLPVLINGDDILFKADTAQYDRWLQGSSSVGFSLSLGKNFVHPRFMTVNSLPIEHIPMAPPVKLTFVDRKPIWLADPTRTGLPVSPLKWADVEELSDWTFKGSNEFVVHGFMNVGLLLGVAKEVDERRQWKLTPLADWHSGAVIGAMNPLRAHNLFLHYHKDEIRRLTRFGKHTLNIFAHPLLGGLGFKIPEGVDPRYSEPQRHLAARLLNQAQSVYKGALGDHPLAPFTRLTSSVKAPASIGTRGAYRQISTNLEVPIGPLNLGQDLLDLDTSIQATPLSNPFEVTEGSYLTASCRLSNGELARLLKSANHGRSTLLPIDKMSSFPYRVVTYDPEWDEWSKTMNGPGWEIIDSPTEPPPHLENPITQTPPLVSVTEVSHDTTWEDLVIPGARTIAPVSRSRPVSEVKRRLQARRQNDFAQGLVVQASSKERSGRWSRKQKRF